MGKTIVYSSWCHSSFNRANWTKRYLETHAKKTTNHDQIFDIMSRLLEIERSHPNVLKNKFLFKKPLQCLECGAKAHSSPYHKFGPLNEFDSLVDSLLIK